MSGVHAPSIAVIVVVRNALEPLQATLDSVFALDHPRVRLIVIDGASTDGTQAYLESIKTQLHFTISEPDRGIYDAMNKGWHAAPADSFVLYMGAGDLIRSLPSPDELTGAAKQGISVLLGRCMVGEMSFQSRWTREMYLRNVAHHQAMMVRKTLHPTAPFDVGYRVYGDWEFNLRLFKAGARAQYIESFQTFADPDGVSARHGLREITRVARRHGGPVIGLLSLGLNWASSLRRRWRLRHDD